MLCEYRATTEQSVLCFVFEPVLPTAVVETRAQNGSGNLRDPIASPPIKKLCGKCVARALHSTKKINNRTRLHNRIQATTGVLVGEVLNSADQMYFEAYKLWCACLLRVARVQSRVAHEHSKTCYA